MDGKNFFKQESMIFKVIYIIGIITFLIHLNALTVGDNEQSTIIPIIAFSTLTLFFIRLIILNKR